MRKHASNLLSARLTPMPPPVIPGKSPRSTKEDNKPDRDIPQSPPQLPASQVQTIQLLEEGVKDFGAWKILLSGKSMRNLRQLRRSDRHMFEIVKKKIK
jgi:hypothetical protein